jgi:hypothetical protein
MNADLLRRVRDVIAAEPERFDMTTFVNATPCGTTCCIAGHASVLTGATVTLHGSGATAFAEFKRDGRMVLSNEHDGGIALDLDEEERDALFYHDNWPAPYAAQMDRAILDGKPQGPIAVRLLDEVLARGCVWWAK